MDVAEARALLRSRDDLRLSGLSDRLIEKAVANGDLHRVDLARYVDGPMWRRLFSEDRHILRLVAAHERSRGRWDAASHVSAAVAHGLPLFRLDPRRVHTSGERMNGRVTASAPMVARHELPVPDEDLVEISGIVCTSLRRTVADVIRQASPETSLALADAALGQVAWTRRTHTYNQDEHDQFVASVLRQLPRGGRGVTQARFILDIADGRAESPGESGSRWALLRLGFARPRLQVPVPGPQSSRYFLDFGLDDVGAWGEFDGETKYTDPALSGSDGIVQVMLDEKTREDWIRGTTGRQLPRWGYADIRTPDTLGERLARFHVFPRR